MDNLPRALIIAASTLLAVMVMAVAIFAIRHVGILQTQQDENERTKQLKDFNMEYEAYNKKIMYGVDVLSCLNKARSNNEKYIKGSFNNFLVGDVYPQEYIIDIGFKIKTPLEDRIIVNYLSATKLITAGVESVKISVKETPFADGLGPKGDKGATYREEKASYENVFSEICTDNYFSNVIGNPSNMIDKGNDISSNVLQSTIFTEDGLTSDNYYHLLKNLNGASIVDGEIKFSNPKKDYFTNPESEDKVYNLLKASTYMKKYVKHTLTPKENNEENATLKFMAWDGSSTSDAGWSSAEWRTALYDFKTRKFKCESMTYSSVTGRIISMVFAEI